MVRGIGLLIVLGLVTSIASGGTTAGTPTDGIPSIIYDPETGVLTIEDEAPSPSLNVVVIQSASAQFITGQIVDPGGGVTVSDTAAEIGYIADDTAGFPNTFGNGDVMGPVLAGYLSRASLLVDLTISYSSLEVVGLQPGTLIAYIPGDATRDLLVDASDIGALLSGFGTGTTWAQGDFNGDDLVDASDVGDILTNFTGDPGPAPAGSVIAEYDTTTGQIIVSVDGVQNWLIEAADGSAVMTGDPANLPGAGGLVTDNDFRVGESNFGGPFTYTDLDLGNVAVAGLVQGDLIAKWQTGFGAPTETIEVVVIPEPASLALLGLGGLLVLRRRRAA